MPYGTREEEAVLYFLVFLSLFAAISLLDNQLTRIWLLKSKIKSICNIVSDGYQRRVFTCPDRFNYYFDRKAKYCCGTEFNRYCCRKSEAHRFYYSSRSPVRSILNRGSYLGAIALLIMALFILILYCTCVMIKRKMQATRNVMNNDKNNTGVVINDFDIPRMYSTPNAYSGQTSNSIPAYPVQHTPYPTQPPPYPTQPLQMPTYPPYPSQATQISTYPPYNQELTNEKPLEKSDHSK